MMKERRNDIDLLWRAEILDENRNIGFWRTNRSKMIFLIPQNKPRRDQSNARKGTLEAIFLQSLWVAAVYEFLVNDFRNRI